MTRTRTLIIIGCFMLALAIIVALELRMDGDSGPEGQMVTGTLSRETPAEPVTSPPAATPPAEQAEAPRPTGLISLDNGTLRASSPGAELPRLPSAPQDPAQTPPQTPEQARLAAPVRDKRTEGATYGPAHKVPEAPVPPAPSSAPAQPEPDNAPRPAGAESAAPAPTAPPAPSAAPSATAGKATPEAPKAAPAPAKPAAEAPKTAPSAQATAPAEAKSQTAKTTSTSAPEKLAPGDTAIIWTTLETTPKAVIFRFTGAKALQGKAFTLSGPDRYVVDLDGGWGFELPQMPANPLVKAIRAGRQGANTRLVFDLAKPLDNCQLVRINPETLEVRLR